MMLSFAYPWLFVLLPIPWLVYRFAPAWVEPQAAIRAPFVPLLESLLGQQARAGAAVGSRSPLQWGLLILLWVLVVAALSRPQWLEAPVTQDLPMRDLLLAVDLSGSMETTDFTDPAGATITRLEAVKQVLGSFLQQRDGDRVGLILFGSAAFVQAPFTDDLEVVEELLQEARVRMLGPRTMLGDAMGLAMNLFEQSELEEKVLIVLTDGNDTGSLVPPVRAAEIARDQSITVHTIAIGDPQAAGEQVLDEDTLQQVAQITGGGFYRAQDQQSLQEIYAELDRLNPRQVETLSYRPRSELFQWPLGLVLVLGIGWLGIVEWTAYRRSRNGTRTQAA